ncbi:MAG TPA: alpha/beta fold hydrolase [Solirubrobacteraceae bacterium]
MDERTDHLGELPVFWRRADGPGATTVYLHGAPMSSDVWLPFLAARGGVAPDLPGFGRSGKPGHFPYALDGYADWLEEFLALAGLDEIDLVMHGWGAVGLAWATRHPDRIRRLVLLDPAPLLPETPWPRLSRALARRVVGEVVIGAAIKPVFTRALLKGGPLPDELVAHAWQSFDPGTQRALLRLHRATDPAARQALAARLADVRRPALVACSHSNPYSSSAWADAFRGRLADATTVDSMPGTGHWPWLDEKKFVERVSRFLTGGMPAPGQTG